MLFYLASMAMLAVVALYVLGFAYSDRKEG
jgi:hypothetical protein